MRKKLEDSIKDKQIYITTNEDISKYGYRKHLIRESGNQQWILKEHDKFYYNLHKEKCKESSRKCKDANKEFYLASAREYARNHKRDILNYNRQYRIENRKKYNEARRIYNKNHPDKVLKHNSKRRKMGFNPLNNLIEGIKCDAHHINKEDVIYIPNVIHNTIFHQSLPHNPLDMIYRFFQCGF